MAKNRPDTAENKELRRLSRTELLELLLEMSDELEKVRGERDELAKKLEDREIKVEKAGTLAEASFALAGILESAQKAADLYLYNLKKMYPASEEEMPPEKAPEEDMPEEDTPEADTPEEGLPEADMPEKDIPEEDLPEEDTPEKGMPEGDTPEDKMQSAEEMPENAAAQEIILENAVIRKATPEEIVPKEIIPEGGFLDEP
ncbi:MAG: hypothetical protein IKE31_04405 [Eubacterium sp.]|nr:hypothetical protein [Eubacterium sp.]